MIYWFRLLLLIGAILAIFAVIGSLLPRSYDFATQIEIEAPRRGFSPKSTPFRTGRIGRSGIRQKSPGSRFNIVVLSPVKGQSNRGPTSVGPGNCGSPIAFPIGRLIMTCCLQIFPTWPARLNWWKLANEPTCDGQVVVGYLEGHSTVFSRRFSRLKCVTSTTRA